jgi:hypothetical protein
MSTTEEEELNLALMISKAESEEKEQNMVNQLDKLLKDNSKLVQENSKLVQDNLNLIQENSKVVLNNRRGGRKNTMNELKQDNSDIVLNNRRGGGRKNTMNELKQDNSDIVLNNRRGGGREKKNTATELKQDNSDIVLNNRRGGGREKKNTATELKQDNSDIVLNKNRRERKRKNKENKPTIELNQEILLLKENNEVNLELNQENSNLLKENEVNKQENSNLLKENEVNKQENSNLLKDHERSDYDVLNINNFVAKFNNVELKNKLLNLFNNSDWKVWNVRGDGKCLIYAFLYSINSDIKNTNELSSKLLFPLKSLIRRSSTSEYYIECNDNIITFKKSDTNNIITDNLNYIHTNCNNLSTQYLQLLHHAFKINILLLTIDMQSVIPFTKINYSSYNNKNMETNEIILLNISGHYYILFHNNANIQNEWVCSFCKRHSKCAW